MSEWQEVTLQDVVSILGDGLHGTPVYDDHGEHFFINGNNLGNRKILIKENTRRTNNDEYKKYRKDLNERTIFISINGTIGNIGTYNGEKCILGKSACYFNVLNSVDKDFMVYVVTNGNFQTYISEFAHGTTIKNVSLRTIREYPFLLPNLAEQKAIASVLSSLDDKIDLLHRQNKTLEAMAETLFRQWFVEEARADWPSGKVSDLIDVLSGFAFKSTSFVESGTYRLMTIKAVQDGFLEKNNADRIADIPVNMPDYCHLQEGDILLSLTGNVGRCCLVDDQKLLLNQRVAKLRPKNERDRAFAYVMFRQTGMRVLLEEMAKGTAQANLSPVEMANMEIQIPSDDTLLKFSLTTTPILSKILFSKREIKLLENLRDDLLPKLMSGDVRVV